MKSLVSFDVPNMIASSGDKTSKIRNGKVRDYDMKPNGSLVPFGILDVLSPKLAIIFGT